ncbi:MAG: DUF3482 domain-containing protein [Polyangiales bacterium]
MTWDDRLMLLRDFQTLVPAWRPALDVAIDGLERQEARRRYKVANIIAELIQKSLTFHLGETLTDERELEFERKRLEQEITDGFAQS